MYLIIMLFFKILAVNGVSLLNQPYNESLLLLQRTGEIVELIVSQIFKQPSSVINNNNPSSPPPNDETAQQLQVRKQHQRNYLKNVDYLKHIRYETNEVNQTNAETKLIRLDAERDQCGYHLMAAKSMPDLPKVLRLRNL